MITREFASQICKDLEDKIVILSGPRQVGKMTLSRSLFPNHQYLNFDLAEHQKIILKKLWDRSKDLIVFDEIHKMDNWKRWVKGIYDTEGVRPRLMLTGSARLETYTNIGDSLAGRFYSYRLHPLDMRELKTVNFEESAQGTCTALLDFSGFPEPFLKRDTNSYKRWQKNHVDAILREDLVSLVEIKNLQKMKLLVNLLKERVASPLSYSSLAEDLQVSYKTVASWISILEKLYIIFRVTPYHKNIARSILKPKYYFYDMGVVSNSGSKLENLVALALQKKMHLLEDLYGEDAQLYYLRNRDGKEIDFLCKTEGGDLLIEVKSSDATPSRHFKHFSKFFKNSTCLQLVHSLKELNLPLMG